MNNNNKQQQQEQTSKWKKWEQPDKIFGKRKQDK